MTNITIKSSWDETRDKLRKKYLDLIDSDFIYLEGKRDEMMEKLAVKIGKTRQELNRIIAFI